MRPRQSTIGPPTVHHRAPDDNTDNTPRRPVTSAKSARRDWVVTGNYSDTASGRLVPFTRIILCREARATDVGGRGRGGPGDTHAGLNIVTWQFQLVNQWGVYYVAFCCVGSLVANVVSLHRRRRDSLAWHVRPSGSRQIGPRTSSVISPRVPSGWITYLCQLPYPQVYLVKDWFRTCDKIY